MAINKQPQLANQFWPQFIRKQITLTVISEIAAVTIVCLCLIVSGVVSPASILFWSLTLVFLIVSLTINIFLVLNTAKPTKMLLGAILNVSGERSSLTPINPNTVSKDQTALGDALKTIYQLSSNSPTEQKSEKDTSPVINALDQTKCGVIAMDADRKIIYSNSAAPIAIKSDGSRQIELIFNGEDNLNNWLDKCAKDEVRADHVWTRIANKLPGEENRRFFDVIVSYRKGLTPETVIILVDRTELYQEDEENLDFISFAAHELRGPITVIKGYVDILRDELADSLQGDQIELFNRLAISSNRLSGYINNILNTSRYDRRHLKVDLHEGTVASVYEVIADDMELRASSQNRLLNVNIPENLPTIAVDKASMSEVFGNLIDNAIKYSNEGGAINVSARVNGGFVEVLVQDNGIGMPESVVNNLFKKFYRSHRSRETVAGTGIGLYISKAIVESHGGSISVRSQDGHGSTFTVSIPIYDTVAEKLKSSDNSNEGLIKEGRGWIKNHSMYRD